MTFTSIGFVFAALAVLMILSAIFTSSVGFTGGLTIFSVSCIFALMGALCILIDQYKEGR